MTYRVFRYLAQFLVEGFFELDGVFVVGCRLVIVFLAVFENEVGVVDKVVGCFVVVGFETGFHGAKVWRVS